MRRTERLFQIIQILRGRRRAPMRGQEIAEELEVSIRTLYRDMAELIAQRVPITGEAGTGYVLDEGYDMPPLMLTADELEAAALGAALVAEHADPSLSVAARDLVAKITEVIPKELRPVVLDGVARPFSTETRQLDRFDGAHLRLAIRERQKLSLKYQDRFGAASERIIWPLFIAYLDNQRFVVAWCETKDDFRHFRTDRIAELTMLDQKYPSRRDQLIKAWEAGPLAEKRRLSTKGQAS